MTKKPITARQASVRKLLSPDSTRISDDIPPGSRPSDRKSRSIFTTALTSATPEQIAQAQALSGPIDNQFCAETYRRTGNPAWLWMSISLTSSGQEIPPEAFTYLKRVGRRFFDEIVNQVQALEQVTTNPGKEFQEYVTQHPRSRISAPDISEILDLSQPGRNPIQAAASDFRAVSAAIAVRHCVEEIGLSREEAYSVLAISLGRTSANEGPSTETVRKIVRKGEKLLPSRGKKVGKT